MTETLNYKVKITIGDAVVEVEGAEKGVVEIVKALSVILAPKPTTPAQMTPTPALVPEVPSRVGPVDIRTFFAEKKPGNDQEAAAVVAFYYGHVAPEDRRLVVIDAKILSDAFRKSGWPLPKRVGQTLRNAKKAGYFDSGSETGTFTLNPVGYNLVEHSLGSEAVEEKVFRPVRRSAKKKTSKKHKTEQKAQ